MYHHTTFEWNIQNEARTTDVEFIILLRGCVVKIKTAATGINYINFCKYQIKAYISAIF